MLRRPRAAPRRSRGFTAVELLVTVALCAVVAAVAMPRLSGRGRASAAAKTLAERIASEMQRLRFAAVSTKQVHRLRWTSSDIIYVDRNTGTDASPVWVNEPSRTIRSGPEAALWHAMQGVGGPTTVQTHGHTLHFRPDFTVAFDGTLSAGVPTFPNSWFWVGGMPTTGVYRGPRYTIRVVGTGSFAMHGGDGLTKWPLDP